MPVIEGVRKVGSGLGLGAIRVARGDYEFAKDGGAVGDVALRGDQIPAGAIVRDVVINVETPPTSGGAATVAIKVESAADMQSAAAISGAPWSSAGAKRGTLTATSAPVKATALRNIVATVGTAALTGGKFQVLVTYYELA